MKSFNLICIWLFGSLTILIANEAREWESSDGKILKAEFISANERIVTIRRTSICNISAACSPQSSLGLGSSGHWGDDRDGV